MLILNMPDADKVIPKVTKGKVTKRKVTKRKVTPKRKAAVNDPVMVNLNLLGLVLGKNRQGIGNYLRSNGVPIKHNAKEVLISAVSPLLTGMFSYYVKMKGKGISTTKSIEDTRYARIRADKIEGEVIPRVEVSLEIQNGLMMFKQKLLNLPTNVDLDLGITKGKILHSLLTEVLNETVKDLDNKVKSDYT